jgi:hypothetical protein
MSLAIGRENKVISIKPLIFTSRLDNIYKHIAKFWVYRNPNKTKNSNLFIFFMTKLTSFYDHIILNRSSSNE